MRNRFCINMNFDAASIERVLQCVRFRQFRVQQLSYCLGANDNAEVTLTVSGSRSINQLIAHLYKIHGVRSIARETTASTCDLP